MRFSRIESRAQFVKLTTHAIVVGLKDGRTVSAPLVWYPRVFHATPAERNRWELIGDGEGIHWPDLDEDIEVDALVAGRQISREPAVPAEVVDGALRTAASGNRIGSNYEGQLLR